MTARKTVRCWGDNLQGQVGMQARGTSFSEFAPVDVLLPDAIEAVAVGDYHSCALTVGGAVKCWGSNTGGQLGVDSGSQWEFTPQAVAVPNLGAGVVAIAAGYWHTCAMMANGHVKCWGENRRGQLGGSKDAGHNAPIDVVDFP